METCPVPDAIDDRSRPAIHPPIRVSAMLVPARARCVAAFALLLAVTATAETAGGYASLVRRAAPSVVTVLVVQSGESAGQRAANRAAMESGDGNVAAVLGRLFSGTPGAGAAGSPPTGLGSGFVIRADGLIVTNRHVIAGARLIRVRLPGGREVPATIMGVDAATDLALLKVSAGMLPALSISSSNDVAIGDPVIAIGNPFGLGQTVTAGILSARGRVLEEDPYIDFLQTDAAINFGNSGGPLLAMDGTVIGVTSAIVSPSGGSVGLGFAIPGETVKAVVEELQAHGIVWRGYLGISAQPMTASLSRALGVAPAAGALVTAVDSDGPSARLLSVGDVLLRLDATPVSFTTLGKVTGRIKPGTTIDATVVRRGATLHVPLTLGQLPDPPSGVEPNGGADTWVASLGLGVADTTAEIRRAIKADGEPSGVIVTQVRPSGAGAMAGLRVGDLLTHAGSEQLTTPQQLAQAMSPSEAVPLLLRVVRGGQPRFVAVTGMPEP